MYKRQGVVCDRCGVEVTKASVRRERMGHIALAAPVSHIWYFKGIPSRMGLILDLSPRTLEKVLYFASYIVLDKGESDLQYKQVLSEAEYQEARETWGSKFRVGMGAESIKELLEAIDLDKEYEELQTGLVGATGQKRARIVKRLEVCLLYTSDVYKRQILYCMAGGMKGAMMTDVIQGSLMFGTAIVTFIVSVKMGGGFENINTTLKSMNESFLTFPGANGYMPWAYFVSNIVLWSFFTMGQPHLFTKFFTMKDHKTMFKAILLGTGGMFLSATLIEWAGVNGIASIQNLEKADQIVPAILQRGLNPFLASIFISGIVAAGMSTIDGILVTTTGAVTRDIYQKIINKKATDETVMSLSKVVTVLIGIVVICFGVFQPGSIFEINLFAFSGMAIFVVPILFGMYWKKATVAGAISSVVVGVIALLAFTLIPSVKALAFGFHALFPATILGSITMIIVSKMTQAPPQEIIDRHFEIFKKNKEMA